MTVWCITMTWKWKPSHLNIIISLLLERKKKSRLDILLESAYSVFLWLQRYHSPRVHGQRNININFMTYMKTLKKAEGTNHSHLFGKKSQFFFNIMSDATLMLPLQQWQDRIRYSVVSHPPYSPDLALSWVPDVCSSKETRQGNSIHMIKKFKLLW